MNQIITNPIVARSELLFAEAMSALDAMPASAVDRIEGGERLRLLARLNDALCALGPQTVDATTTLAALALVENTQWRAVASEMSAASLAAVEAAQQRVRKCLTALQAAVRPRLN